MKIKTGVILGAVFLGISCGSALASASQSDCNSRWQFCNKNPPSKGGCNAYDINSDCFYQCACSGEYTTCCPDDLKEANDLVIP